MQSTFSTRRTLPVLFALVAFWPAFAQVPAPPKREVPPKKYNPEAIPAGRVDPRRKREKDTPPEALDIILEGGKQKKFELAQIAKASTGVILRGSKEQSFTPLTVVMDAAGIPKNSRIRVKGSDRRQNELLLQRNAPPLADPEDYGFIIYPDGFARLAHKPGPPKPEGTPVERWPEVKQVISIEVVPATSGK